MWIQRLDRQTLIMKVGNQIQFSRGNGGKQKYEKEGKSVLKNQLRNYPSKHRHQFQENSVVFWIVQDMSEQYLEFNRMTDEGVYPGPL